MPTKFTLSTTASMTRQRETMTGPCQGIYVIGMPGCLGENARRMIVDNLAAKDCSVTARDSGRAGWKKLR